MCMRFVGWIIVCVAALVASLPAAAQDIQPPEDLGTSTPPELRDFRLDTPPARNEPRDSQSQQTPAPTPSTEPAPQPTAPSDQRERRQQATNNSASRARTTAPQAVQSQPPVAQPPADQITSRTEIAPSATVPPVPKTKTPDGIEVAPNPWLWALGLFAALTAAALFLRRRTALAVGAAEGETLVQPSPPVRLKGPANRSLRPDALPQMDMIAAAFTPETAQLSIASLTVTGRLTIANKGASPIDNLLIRSQMMSAQANQHEVIAAFHSDSSMGSIQHLGGLAVGETIDALIEIRLPRIELAAFRWTEREFVPPIVLVNISGQADDQAVKLRLSHLIGRIGADGGARMKPLAVDRGPKRFTGVTAKPLFA